MPKSLMIKKSKEDEQYFADLTSARSRSQAKCPNRQTSCFVIYQSFELANFCSFFEFIIIIRYVIVIIVPFKKNYRSRLVLWSPIGHVIGAGTRRSSITGFEFKLFVIGHLRHSHVYYTRLKASFSIFPKFLLKFIKSATTTNFNVQKKI